MHGSRRIPKDLHEKIFQLWAGGISQGGMSFVLIAERFGVDDAYIRRIVRRRLTMVSSGFTMQSCGSLL